MTAATPTLFLMVGHVGAGKSTRAREIAAEWPAVRLVPDDWMMPLFGHPDVDGKRAVLEGLLLLNAIDTLRLGVSVILDFGLWRREERAALHWLAARLGIEARTEFLTVDPETQWERVDGRWAQMPPGTWRISREELLATRDMVEEPSADELAGQLDLTPPEPHRDWSTWIAERWSLPPEALSAKNL
jgi:predicted kinase